MNQKLIGKQMDTDGRTRFYVLPVASKVGFKDLVKFVAEEFGCVFGDMDEGPGTIVLKGNIGRANLTFVLSDSSGAQFFADVEEDVEIAERIANGVEARLREVMLFKPPANQ